MTELDFADRTDFENAASGLIDAGDPVTIKAADGRVVFDLEPYAYLAGDCPDTVNPSLWRQAQLCVTHGLFEVTDGIYQVRGFDLSNMTIVEGTTGVIVIDPLISAECAAAAIALYRKHRGDRRGGRRDLHALARRPLRRRDGCAARRRGRRPDPRARRVPGARRLGERLRRCRDEPSGHVPVRRDPAGRPHRPDEHGARHPHLRRHRRPAGADRWTSPTPARRRRSTGCASSSRSRRAPRRRRR